MTSPLRPRKPGGGRPMPMAHGSLLNVAPPTSSAFNLDVMHASPLGDNQLNPNSNGEPLARVNTPRLSLDFRSTTPTPQNPDPDPTNLPPTQPLSLRPKLNLVYGNSASSSPNPSRPSLGLSISGGGGGGKKLGGLSLAIPSATTAPRARPDDSPLDSYYNAGMLQKNPGSSGLSSTLFAPDTEPHSTETLRPPVNTIVASKGGPGGGEEDPLTELQKAIDALTIATANMEGLESNEVEQEPKKWDDSMFEQIRRLGEGAGGAVHQVRHKATGKLMAMKTIPANPETPPRQLHRELEFLSTCIHPNITEFYGAFLSSPSSSNADVHLLMEFCEGGSLDAVARKLRQSNRRIGEPVVGKVAEGVLKGLDYLHGRKIIHRDIKPSNILMTRDGVVKLCDFGVSGVLVNSMAGTFTGTSWYMAPERIRGDPYTIRSDVWSTGLTILELAQNRFPYPPDLGPIELLSYIVNGEVPELEDEPPGPGGEGGAMWSANLKDFIKTCLIVSMTDRPSPKEILNHPWIKQSQETNVRMDKWMLQVWGWPKPQRPSGSTGGPGARRSRSSRQSMDTNGQQPQQQQS